MEQAIQLIFLLSIVVGVFGIAMQIMVRAKNLPVINQLIKSEGITLFLGIGLIYNLCEFFGYFFQHYLSDSQYYWILTVEDVFDILFLWLVTDIEIKYSGIKERKTIPTVFIAVTAIILWTDISLNLEIIFMEDYLYEILSTIIYIGMILMTLYISIKTYLGLDADKKNVWTKIFYITYNVFLVLLTAFLIVYVFEGRWNGAIYKLSEWFFSVLWSAFNLFNAVYIWKSCTLVSEEKEQIFTGESTEERFNHIAGEFGLSEREAELAVLLCMGKNNNEIAAESYLAVGTVKTHISNLYRKLGAKNRVQAMRILCGEEKNKTAHPEICGEKNE